jgi:4-hydroxy-tetrahydrodipicolinate synthase
MKKNKAIQGCGTALVTPFLDDGQLDEAALRKLVQFQVKEGIDFLVPCGSTGESAALSHDEHCRVVEVVVEAAAGKVPVVAGAGGCNTAKVVELAKAVERLGVDALLSVTPYYNRPTQEGLVQHYRALAEAVRLPIFLYNVPGRTSTNLLPDTVVRLADSPNIVGIKEASGNIDQITELAVKRPKSFQLLSGDDANTIAIVSVGGTGLISVVSNETPRKMTQLTHAAMEGRFDKALSIQKELYALMRANFIETSPGPVKAAMAMMGLIRENLRLPLVPVRPDTREKVRVALVDLGLV